MAEVMGELELEVRAPKAGEGGAISRLWRQLWESQAAMGGYPATGDSTVYAQLAACLDADALVRAGRPAVHRHIHLVAVCGTRVVGQVEGLWGHYGRSLATPPTCEVHSLVVEAESQSRGIGKALLTGIDRAGVALMDGGGALLAAEVLELNPAFRFYEKQGFFPVSYVTALPTKPTYALPKGYAARRAIAGDASILAKLDRVLAERRFQQGDPRWDLPRAVDSKEIGLLAEHLARDSQSTNSREIVVEDPAGVVRASACLAVSPLEYPFRLGRRACLGRLSIEPGFPIEPFVEAVLAEGARLAALQGAERMEVTDLPSPESMLYRATLVVGARPWSRIMCRPVEPPSEASLSAR